MRPPLPNPFREAWAGQLRSRQAGEVLQVAGFVHRRRDHGGVVFIDLRDRSGILQLVFHSEAAHRLRSEDVLTARGRLELREPGNVNPNLATGEVEVHVDAFEVLSDAEPPPFPIDEDGEVNEDVRLRHRALDLRRDRMREAIELRHRVTSAIRSHLDAHDFLEIETPLLTRSTPEGARDFLVPSRVRPGAAFALPQSPQLFKQLLMLAGFERYYQIARCFRDEDSRADRLPEFTQLDMELSFVDEEGVMGLVEGLMHRVFEEAGFSGVPAPPYERLPYDEAMLRFGTDRPDRRFGLEITDLSEALAGTDARVFAGALAGGGVVRALNAGARELARSDLDRLVELAREWGAQGLAWAWIEEGGGWRSPIAKFLSEGERAAVVQRVRAAPGDVVFFVADRAPVAAEVLGLLRLELGERFGLRGGPHHDLLWIVDFPLFERDPDTGTWDPLHHPFTAPVGDVEGDPGALRSRAYDLVMNGTELGGGSIRINRADVQERVLRLLRIGPEEAQERFGFLLDALRYGAPPHGGIAFGLDRIVALLLGRDSIREVIAFPKTASGLDPLTGAPAPPSREQLRELGITVRAP